MANEARRILWLDEQIEQCKKLKITCPDNALELGGMIIAYEKVLHECHLEGMNECVNAFLRGREKIYRCRSLSC